MTLRPTFFYDFIDPGSYVASHIIDQAEATAVFEWRGFELRPPPVLLIDPGNPEWRTYREDLVNAANGLGAPMATPTLVPWTRKAHELAEFARERDCYHIVRRALFKAYFVDQTDIGRIDLLVDIGHGAGLHRSEVKAALDVDRYSDVVFDHRVAAQALGIGEVPALVSAIRRHEGLTDRVDVSQWKRYIRKELIASTELRHQEE